MENFTSCLNISIKATVDFVNAGETGHREHKWS